MFEIVRVVGLLARMLDEHRVDRPGALGTHALDRGVVVEVCHHLVRTHRVERYLRRGVHRRVVHEHGASRGQNRGKRPAQRTRARPTHEAGVLGVEGVGKDPLHPDGLERPVGAGNNAQVTEVERLLAREAARCRVDHGELEVAGLLDGPGVQRVADHAAPPMVNTRAGFSTSIWCTARS